MEQDQKVKAQKQAGKWAHVRELIPKVEKERVVAEVAVVDAKDDLQIRTKMPRPCKRRRIRGRPNSSFFKPAGVRLNELAEIILTMPEFEAIRLIDFQEMSQVQACEKMMISQSTFSRILTLARKKIADAIINGKAIRIIQSLN